MSNSEKRHCQEARKILDAARRDDKERPCFGGFNRQELAIAELLRRIERLESLEGDSEREFRINAARQRKVARLLAVFWKHEFTPSQVRRMTTDQWAIAAKAAGINPPSEATRSMLWAHLGEVEDK